MNTKASAKNSATQKLNLSHEQRLENNDADSKAMSSINSMLKLKQHKKTVDNDAMLLANRITMLQNEEMKIMKKIENTRKRAEQILEIKK